MSQNKSTPFLVTDAKNLTLIDTTRENSHWCLNPLVLSLVFTVGRGWGIKFLALDKLTRLTY